MANLPTLEFLLNCSTQALADLELASLNRSANSLKRARLEWDEAVAQRETAGVARWLLEHREALLAQARQTIEAQAVLQFPAVKKTA